MNPRVFIGDVAGQFKTLIKLVSLCPSDRDILLLGDLVDRGPSSRQVIEWAMSHDRMNSLYSNHEDMMIDWYYNRSVYEEGVWTEYNGGNTTLDSYTDNFSIDHESLISKIPKEHIEWLENRPMYIETDEWIATHAPIYPGIPLAECLEIRTKDRFAGNIIPNPYSVIWNRIRPSRMDKFQIHGHNSNWGLKYHSDQSGPYGICLDTSSQSVLTAFLWPEQTLVQVGYID